MLVPGSQPPAAVKSSVLSNALLVRLKWRRRDPGGALGMMLRMLLLKFALSSWLAIRFQPGWFVTL